jgi:hypothetical protein
MWQRPCTAMVVFFDGYASLGIVFVSESTVVCSTTLGGFAQVDDSLARLAPSPAI